MAGERDKLHVQSIGGRTVSNDSFVDLRFLYFFIIYCGRFVVRISHCFCLRTDFNRQSLTTESGAMCRRTTISTTRLTNYHSALSSCVWEATTLTFLCGLVSLALRFHSDVMYSCHVVMWLRSTADNSNLQGKSKKVRVIGSSKNYPQKICNFHM